MTLFLAERMSLIISKLLMFFITAAIHKPHLWSNNINTEKTLNSSKNSISNLYARKWQSNLIIQYHFQDVTLSDVLPNTELKIIPTLLAEPSIVWDNEVPTAWTRMVHMNHNKILFHSRNWLPQLT
jgi:hypothetical protein